MTRPLLLAVALLVATPAVAQRTGGSFGGSAWGSRPAVVAPPVTRPAPPPPRPVVVVVARPRPVPPAPPSRPVVAPAPVVRTVTRTPVRAPLPRPSAPSPAPRVPRPRPSWGVEIEYAPRPTSSASHDTAPVTHAECDARPGARGSWPVGVVLVALVCVARRRRS